ncbi:MAG: hypothetical protein KatS3mg003_1466 [Candidatus Nitrosocaldaceae archaeon]|nr:MAG: hypothetical protein KatS3mg003_1466 [Candidatus Nitrosocaldaceae archaeon]
MPLDYHIRLIIRKERYIALYVIVYLSIIIRCPCCNYYTRHNTRNAKSKREYNIEIK